MYETVEAWLDEARAAARRYADHRRLIEQMEAESARLLADMVQAYAWPENLTLPERRDVYGPEEINGADYGVDLSCELAVANKSSETSARFLVGDVAALVDRLPGCWRKVVQAEAPLWQARRVADACRGLEPADWLTVDQVVAPALGAIGPRRLMRVTDAAVKLADPAAARRRASLNPTRFVHSGGDEFDPLSGWVSARLDRSDALFLDATVQLIADRLAGQGDTATQDQRRAKALGLLANPAAAIQLTGLATTRGMNPVPQADVDKQAFVRAAAALIPAFTPRVQVFVHLFADSLAEPEALARLKSFGPLLTSQVAQIARGCRIRLTPAIHVGGDGIAVDQYEIPARIRDHVLLRTGHDVFPWSSIESRRLDLDHTVPYQAGQANQTRSDNLGPLSRRAHRAKTLAGWQLDQLSPGNFVWRTPAGQVVSVDPAGSHHIRDGDGRYRYRFGPGSWGPVTSVPDNERLRMISTNDIKNGTVLNLDGQLWTVTWFQHHKPGKGNTVVRTKLKHVLTGKVVDRTFNSDIKIEDASVDRNEMQYLYHDTDGFVFMDTADFSQMTIPDEIVGDAKDFLLENGTATVTLHEGNPLFIELPASVELVVTYTEPGLQGDRSSAGTKPATLETGRTIQVPLFVVTGDKIKVDTRDASYISRV